MEIDKIVSLLVNGQIFVDYLEDIQEGKIDLKGLFKQNLKFHASETIKELRSKVDSIYDNIGKEDRRNVNDLISIDLKLLSFISKLKTEEKIELSEALGIK
jgi:hypothetical protein